MNSNRHQLQNPLVKPEAETHTSSRTEWVEQVRARIAKQGRADQPSPLLTEWMAKNADRIPRKT